MPEHTIAENLARLQAARTAIAGAITAKGGTVTTGDGFEEFPADIATIPSGVQPEMQCLEFSGTEPFTLTMNGMTKYYTGTIECSVDKENWTEISLSTVMNSGANNKLYLRGKDNIYFSRSGTATTSASNFVFTTNGYIDCVGNVDSLLDYRLVTYGFDPGMGNRCFYRLFYNCTALRTPPSFSQSALRGLSEQCYYGMFEGCTNLLYLPRLAATTLKKNCYDHMFYGCSKIKLSDTQTDEYNTPYEIPTEGGGTTASNALSDMFANTGGTFTGSPTINTTYYTSNTVV